MARRSSRSGRVSTAQLKRLLRSRFGLSDFRPGQEAVIRNVLAGIDTLAVMSTGAGKSLCYQLPGLLLPGTTLIVSPLIALMNDQADKLDGVGVDTARLNSTLRRADEDAALARISDQASEMVFVTPERLGTPQMLERLRRNRIDVAVIDEAHCISHWGHDFRPAFLEIANALQALGDPPVLALTATATPEVVADIGRQLRRPGMAVVHSSIYRPNLRYAVTQVTNEQEKATALDRALTRIPGTRLVYAATVKAAEALHETLGLRGHPVVLYHGRMRAGDRHESQTRFMQARDVIMVATNAFGMGIDKPDVRAVIHYQMPATLEAYYQESGRAGRDGESAECRLLFDAGDKRIQQFFLGGRYPDANDIMRAWQAVAHSAGAFLPSARIPDIAGKGAVSKLRVALKALADAGKVRPEEGGYAAGSETVDARAAEAVAQAYHRRSERDRLKLEQLVAYAYSARCRWITLLDYFDEAAPFERCGTCDNCVHPPEAVATQPAQAQAAPEHDVALQLGQRVTVPRYGAGTVTRIAGEAVGVALSDGKERTFIRAFVQPVHEQPVREHRSPG